jgi:hydroxyethylthiazole kinase
MLSQIKQKKPLIHHITNYVVANETANLTLCLGALPVMAQSIDEVEEMVSIASALVLNIGTLDKPLIDSMIKAGRKANELNIPIVLDPVGAGATTLRTNSSKKLLAEFQIDIIRGNAAEVATLAGIKAEVRGVESMSGNESAKEAALSLNKSTSAVIAVTGKEDIVVADGKTALIANGHPMLGAVTGTGCMSTTAVATFCSISENNFDGCIAGLVAFGIAGEKAARGNINKPGSFHAALYDAVSSLSGNDFIKAKVFLH